MPAERANRRGGAAWRLRPRPLSPPPTAYWSPHSGATFVGSEGLDPGGGFSHVFLPFSPQNAFGTTRGFPASRVTSRSPRRAPPRPAAPTSARAARGAGGSGRPWRGPATPAPLSPAGNATSCGSFDSGTARRRPSSWSWCQPVSAGARGGPMTVGGAGRGFGCFGFDPGVSSFRLRSLSLLEPLLRPISD